MYLATHNKASQFASKLAGLVSLAIAGRRYKPLNEKTMKSKYLLSLALLIATTTYANDWSGNTTVKEIISGYKEGIILFKTTQAHHNPANDCSAEYYSVNKNDADLEVVLSVLLAAQRSGSEIQVGVDSTTCGSISHATGRINVTRVKSL